jgi:hypothetical protein
MGSWWRFRISFREFITRTSNLLTLNPPIKPVTRLQTCHPTSNLSPDFKPVIPTSNLSPRHQTCHPDFKPVTPTSNLSPRLQTCHPDFKPVTPTSNLSPRLQICHPVLVTGSGNKKSFLFTPAPVTSTG